MFVCKKCKSKRIKTRSNSPYGKKSKSRVTPVRCKDCGSTIIENVNPNARGRRRYK